MSVFRDQKMLLVTEIQANIDQSQSMVVATYQGLTVKQMQALRKLAKAKDVKIIIYKNRLVKKAIESGQFNDLAQHLSGPNLYAFSQTDSISAAKVLFEFAKTHKQVQLVAGIVEKQVLDQKAILEVATLPTYEEALTILARSLQGALQQIAIGLKMLVDENHIKE